jgi:hypothetical protein
MIITEKYYPSKEVGKIVQQSLKKRKRPGNGKDDDTKTEQAIQC